MLGYLSHLLERKLESVDFIHRLRRQQHQRAERIMLGYLSHLLERKLRASTLGSAN